jgi:GDP-4-dehydro-6-deoxy-D-mannose reductase
MRCLITGVAGFVGSHLIELLLKIPNIEIFGADRWYTKKDNIWHLLERFKYLEFDMTDYSSVIHLLELVKPDKIFHLAAQSFVPTSYGAPSETINTNVIGQLNIFEACRQLNIDPTFQIACSSEEYGLVFPNENPIKESNPFRPISPYAVSKIGQDMLGFQYAKSFGLKVVRTRAFNHTGPRQSEQFVTSSFAKQIAEIEAAEKEPVLSVGNIDTKRDFLDVRDIARAYWLATEKCTFGEVYNVCLGKSKSIREILENLISLSPKAKHIVVKEERDRIRANDVENIYGDNSKFVKETGWEPIVPFERTMKDLLDYWRGIVRKRSSNNNIIL